MTSRCLQKLVFDGAGKALNAVSKGEADIGFFAIDPLRSEGIYFTSPYILIEGAYLVREGSPIQKLEQVDMQGTRICVGKGSAYDLHTRAIEHAAIVRAPTSPTVVDVFLEQKLEVAAGVRQQLELDAQRIPGLQLLPGRFMVIEQAMGVHAGHGAIAHQLLSRFVEFAKAEGLLQAAIQRHGTQGAEQAP